MAREVNTVAPWAEIVPNAPYPMSIEQFGSLPNDGWRYELVRGRLVRMPPPKPYHGMVAKRVSRALENFVEQHGLGEVIDQGSGFALPNPGKPGEEITLGPDVAFVAKGRGPKPDTPDYYEEYWHLAPDLAVEVASQDSNQYRPEMQKKALEYLHAGTREVWILYPQWNELDIWYYGEHGPEARTFKANQQVESPLLPDFTPTVGGFFPALDVREPGIGPILREVTPGAR